VKDVSNWVLISFLAPGDN